MDGKYAPLNPNRRSGATDLLNLVTAMEPNGIERQEEQGQRSFVGSDTLPVKLNGAKEILERAGVEFLGPVEGDDQFQYVELPAGWKKVATSHSMWSELRDGKGRVRASIFYKAAFYDREAFLNLRNRYRYERDYSSEDAATYHVLDGTTIIHTVGPVVLPGGKRDLAFYNAADAVGDQAKAWLEERFPHWQSSEAYWD